MSLRGVVRVLGWIEMRRPEGGGGCLGGREWGRRRRCTAGDEVRLN